METHKRWFVPETVKVSGPEGEGVGYLAIAVITTIKKETTLIIILVVS